MKLFVALYLILWVSSSKATLLRLSPGQIVTKEIRNLRSFSIGNKRTINAKHDKKANLLIIRAKNSGYSDLFFTTQKKAHHPKAHRISILVKKKSLPIGISPQKINQVTFLKGRIQTFGHYRMLVPLASQYNMSLLKIKPDLKAEIWKEFLIKANSFGVSQWKCSFQGALLTCLTNESDQKLTFLKKNFLVGFHSIQDCREKNQYLVKIKVFQVEDYSGRELSLGLERLYSQISQVFEVGFLSLIQTNLLKIYQKELSLNTLAEKEAVVSCGNPFEFKVGSEIPFQNQDPIKGISTQWKFAGLSIKAILKKSFLNHLYLQYQTQFSSPMDSGGISGSSQESTLEVRNNKSIKLFEMGFHAKSKGSGGIPFLKEIPILGALFQSSENKESYKKIFAVFHIKEIYATK